MDDGRWKTGSLALAALLTFLVQGARSQDFVFGRPKRSRG